MTAAGRHWHGYLWTGSTEELKKRETGRRPGGLNEVQGFRPELPPLQTGYYLRRRPDAGLTWIEVDDVVAWMVTNRERHRPTAREDGTQAWPGLDQRRETTRDGLLNGVDGWWQYHTGTGTEIVIAAIVCPHSHLRDIACPMPPQTSRPTSGG
ncbi:hypothetical protein [Actinoplanes sp. L3-i22]|uniref:hypothetical protein n=1 Tax=Actinoplanes sp. L3-i22 TaxID=2836373 RepID=UPI001C7478EB|nr:hypothetical protein [Actinoplanes sp. L3-i22]BCY14157.1 hypothetical protein L3i22_092450 [Actinoplanes sp. L3-i22]